MADVSISIKAYKTIQKKINDKKKGAEQVFKALASDATKRVPGWVSTEVAKEYGVKKTEITGKKIGSVKVNGSQLKDLKFVYTGRRLTPTHFSMNPKAPSASYTLKAAIIKGKRTTLGKVKKLTKKQRQAIGKNFTKSGTQRSDHSPIMLMHTGNAQSEGTNYIPFQRKSKDRKDVEVIRTVSLPQMVSSKRTQVGIQKAMTEGLQKRLDHHTKRYMG